MRSALERRIAEEISFALFMTSAMLMTGSFASHLKYQHSEPLSPLAGLLEIMTLTRGLSAIRTTALAELRFNVLDKLKQNDCSQPDCKTNDVLKTQLSILQSRLSSLTDVDDAAKAVVKAGAQSILDCMDTTKTPGTSMSSEIHLIFTWLTRLSGDFFSLLQAQHPGSLVVLLYYVVALQEAESQCWILEGWSAQLTISIAGLLTAPWTELAQWAMDELRHSQGTTS
ncbi:fungal zn binuclear cluster domain-containing protein [Fusarium flagelliforme]|uniref:Fungal zn binuclear cluster domain-containing protein n=2 Tax=Fusarium flagelliforme TaxID=2675880 RepID=A0A395MEC9_9HYPO|nr:fungal zn binuclear cluster domain-containing protein [Fusarium flagelliforme]